MTRHANQVAMVLAVVALAVAAGCQRDRQVRHEPHVTGSAGQAVAVLNPTQGSDTRGVVTFTQRGGVVDVVAEVSGLKPNSRHAIHVHEFGDARAADAMSAGSHYNPEGHPHGLPNGGVRHAGDFGNLSSNANGFATLRLTVDNLTINGQRNPVLGRSVIVHADPDDGSQPVGNAGGRIAVGVIGVAKPQGGE